MSYAPSCFGCYRPACEGRCAERITLKCLAYRQTLAQEAANRLARRRAGELGPAGRALVRLGYPPRVAQEADRC